MPRPLEGLGKLFFGGGPAPGGASGGLVRFVPYHARIHTISCVQGGSMGWWIAYRGRLVCGRPFQTHQTSQATIGSETAGRVAERLRRSPGRRPLGSKGQHDERPLDVHRAGKHDPADSNIGPAQRDSFEWARCIRCQRAITDLRPESYVHPDVYTFSANWRNTICGGIAIGAS